MRYGTIPAGGLGTRLQPLGFSKELAPVARRAVIEYLIERMVLSGIEKIFINTAEDKTDLIRYLSTKSPYHSNLVFMVRPRRGLFDGIALPSELLRDDDELYFGLPDTIWYPKDSFSQLDKLSSSLVLGLFDTGTPEKFDSVVINSKNEIQSIKVKIPNPQTKWTWAIGKMTVKAAKIMRTFEYHQDQPRLFGDIMQHYVEEYQGSALELAKSACIDIGVPEEYERADAFVKAHE